MSLSGSSWYEYNVSVWWINYFNVDGRCVDCVDIQSDWIFFRTFRTTGYGMKFEIKFVFTLNIYFSIFVFQHLLCMQEKTKALEACKVKSDFLTVVSHELRTPINGMFTHDHSLYTSGLCTRSSTCLCVFRNTNSFFACQSRFYSFAYYVCVDCVYFSAVLGTLQIAVDLIVDHTVMPLLESALNSTELLLDIINQVLVYHHLTLPT